MERTAAIVKISSEHPSSFEAKIIFEIIGSYKRKIGVQPVINTDSGQNG